MRRSGNPSPIASNRPSAVRMPPNVLVAARVGSSRFRRGPLREDGRGVTRDELADGVVDALDPGALRGWRRSRSADEVADAASQAGQARRAAEPG